MFSDLSFSENLCRGVGPYTPEVFAKYCSRFFDGFGMTIGLLVLSVVFGLILAVFVALARISPRQYLAVPCNIYSYIFRGTPLLVQLWIIYFGIGSFGEDGLGSTLWLVFGDAWWVGLIVLILNTAAYTSEILRGGILNIPAGQTEAAMAVGMSRATTMRRIILPQAFRLSFRAYGNEIILLLKGTALVSTITVMDLMGQTRTIFSRGYNLDVFVYATLLYLVIAGIITVTLRQIEQRLSRPGVV
ncbi:MAG: ABC transporter permease subunit [Candidatus Symbiobacter sp.]|nr:ABC transporter permease subunit [Candidatus Symbiobacter sp.]